MEQPSLLKKNLAGSLTKELLNIAKDAIVGTKKLTKPSRKTMYEATGSLPLKYCTKHKTVSP